MFEPVAIVSIISAVGLAVGVLTKYWLDSRKQELNHVSTESIQEATWHRSEFDRLATRIEKLEVDNASCMKRNSDLERGLGEALGKIAGLTALITQIQADHQKVVVEAVAEKTAEVAVAKVEAAVEQAVGAVKTDRVTTKAAAADAESRKPKPGNMGR